MHIISGTAPGVLHLPGAPQLSNKAKQRLRWMDYYEEHGRDVRGACSHFYIDRQKFYRWKKRYDPYNLKTLEDRSQRPRHLRQPTASPELVEAVLKLREEYPRWGKDKLVVLLHKQGYQVSTSMVGRTIKRLKERGILREPIPNHISAESGPEHVLTPRESPKNTWLRHRATLSR